MIAVSIGLCTLALRDADGIMRYAVDWLGSPSAPGGGDPAESVTPFGFRCRPRDPDLDPEGRIIAGKGAGLVLLDDGGESFAWPTQDPRYRTVLPALPAGSSELHATHADGTVTRLTVDGDTGDVVVTTKTGATVKVLADGTLEVGGDAAVALAKADEAVALVKQLAQIVATGTSTAAVGPLSFLGTPPAIPPLSEFISADHDIGATKAKST